MQAITASVGVSAAVLGQHTTCTRALWKTRSPIQNKNKEGDISPHISRREDTPRGTNRLFAKKGLFTVSSLTSRASSELNSDTTAAKARCSVSILKNRSRRRKHRHAFTFSFEFLPRQTVNVDHTRTTNFDPLASRVVPTLHHTVPPHAPSHTPFPHASKFKTVPAG